MADLKAHAATTPSLSIILPARNEAASLTQLIPALRQAYPDAEIIVVNDGSTDNTAAVAIQGGAKVVNHPHSLGNGAAVKSGARAATREILAFMDADGQHRPASIAKLLAQYQQGYSMVIGARTRAGQASTARWLGNLSYNWIASRVVGQPIKDLTSGFRVVNRQRFLKFLHLLPNGFSYPSTITMAFLRTGYPVDFVNVEVDKRVGKSHLKPLSDGIRFLIIIYKVAILYSPLKIFVPFAVLHLFSGIAYYAFVGRLTYLSTILISAAIIIFLIGLVSEQITTLMYQQKSHENFD